MDPAGKIEVRPWMEADETKAVMTALTAAGEPARFVGGCVRDTVLGRAAGDIDNDIDIATMPQRGLFVITKFLIFQTYLLLIVFLL